MRPPVIGSPAIPPQLARVASGLATLLLLIGLQEPWSAGERGADSWLITGAVLLAVVGASLGLMQLPDAAQAGQGGKAGQAPVTGYLGQSGQASGATPASDGDWLTRVMRFRWAAQLPVALVVVWYLIREFIWGANFGVGAAMALTGAVLAAQFGTGALPKHIKLVLIGSKVAILAVVAPIVLAVSGTAWPILTLNVGFAVMVLYLTWWLFIPILQFESKTALKVFPYGKYFPRCTTEQITARAAVLTLVGAGISAVAIIHGGASDLWVAGGNQAALAVMFVPAVGAASLAIAGAYWRRCAPALLRKSLAQVAIVTATALVGYVLLSFGVHIATEGWSAMVITGLSVVVILTTLGWFQFLGIVSFGRVGQRVTRGIIRMFRLGASNPDVPSSSWLLPDLPLRDDAVAPTEKSSHQWTGPRFNSTDPTFDGEPTAVSGPISTNSVGIDSIVAPVVTKPRAATTSHVALPANTQINSQVELESVGASNPALTESGRLVIPLARPKWTPQQALDPATHAAMLVRIASEAPHLRPQVARNPAATPELLNWLASLNDPDVNLVLQNSTQVALR